MFVFRNSFDFDSSEISGKLICQIESKTEFEHHWMKYAVKYIDGRDNLKEKSKEELKEQLNNWDCDKSLKLKYKDKFNFQIKKNGDVIEMKLKDCNMIVTFGIYQLKKETPKETKKEPKKETPKEPKKETPKKPKKETPKETKKEPKKETPKEPKKETPKEPKKESKKETHKETKKEPKKEELKKVKFDNSKVIYSNGISEFRFEGSKKSMKELTKEIENVNKDIKKENKEDIYKTVSTRENIDNKKSLQVEVPEKEPSKLHLDAKEKSNKETVIDYSERTKNIKDERLKKRIKEILGNVE